MRPTARESKTVARLQRPCLVVHCQHHLAFEHEAGFLAVMGVELVAGGAAGLQMYQEQIEPVVAARRAQQLLRHAGAPEFQFGPLKPSRDDLVGCAVGIRARAEQRGDADAEHVGERCQHAQRRRRQAAFDLAEEADREIRARSDRLERELPDAPEIANTAADRDIHRRLGRFRNMLVLALAFTFTFICTFFTRFAAAGLRILLPPLTSNRFLHVHENRLHRSRKCDQIFILVKIGRNGLARNVCDDDICERRHRPGPRGMR